MEHGKSLIKKLNLPTVCLFPALLLNSTAFAGPITLDEAITLTLLQNPDVEISNIEVETALSDVQAAGGEFDPTIIGGLGANKRESQSYSSTTFQETETTTRNEYLEFGVSQQLRNSATLSFTNTFQNDRTDRSPLGTVATNEWVLGLSIPLLKGLGEEAATASENIAIKTYDSTKLSSAHSISDQLSTTIASYWASLGVQENYTNLNTTMERASQTAQMLNEQQEGGELAFVEYQRSLAELKLREVDLEQGRADKYEAQEDLALAIGSNRDDALPEAVGPFPEPATRAQLNKLILADLLDLALENRLDVLAQKALIEAAQIQVFKSNDDTMPDLSFDVEAGYTNSESQYSSSDTASVFKDDQSGLNYSIGLSLSYPLGNNAALGSLSRDKAALSTEKLNMEKLQKVIRNEINIAVDQIKAAVRSYELASLSLEMMESVAVETSRKLNSGEATMTDVISVEDRLTEGRLRKIEALQDYAIALANLRFSTGTLTTGTGSDLAISSTALMTLPLIELATGAQ